MTTTNSLHTKQHDYHLLIPYKTTTLLPTHYIHFNMTTAYSFHTKQHDYYHIIPYNTT